MSEIFKFCLLTVLCAAVQSCSNDSRVKVNRSNVIVDEEINHDDTIHLIVKGKENILPSDTIQIEIINNKDTICSTGQYYKIEQIVGDKLIAVPLGPGVFYDIGYEIKAHNSRRFKIDLNETKNPLQEGTYRISKIVKYRGEELVVSDEITI